MKATARRTQIPGSSGAGGPPGSVTFWTITIALLAIALYLPAIGFGLVYDSNPQILIDDFVHLPRHFLDVLSLRVMGMDVLDFNRPVNLFTLLVDSQIWGKNPAGYHLTSLLLHGVTVALLFRWLLRLTEKPWAALAAALLFAVHPLHCETVVEVGYREDLLATLFLLAGLLCATAFRPTVPGGAFRSVWLPGIGAGVCFFLSVASKESGIAGPVALLVYWFLFRSASRGDARPPNANAPMGRASVPASLHHEGAPNKVKSGLPSRAWLILMAGVALAAAAFLTARFALELKISAIFDAPPSRLAPTWGALLLAQCRIFVGEFQRIVWPSNLCADYNGNSIKGIDSLESIVVLMLVLAVQGYLCCFGRQRRLMALGTALFWLSLAPVSNLVPIYRPMADRFLYTPMAGLALMVAAGLASIRPRERRRVSLASWALVLTVAVTLASVTWREEQNWRDELTLWTTTAERNPMSFNAWLGIGYARLNCGEPSQAVEPFGHASALARGARAEPWTGLALAAEEMGRHREAVECLQRAVALDRRYADPESIRRSLLLDQPQTMQIKAISLRSASLRRR